jgi:hypothetical protein
VESFVIFLVALRASPALSIDGEMDENLIDCLIDHPITSQCIRKPAEWKL